MNAIRVHEFGPPEVMKTEQVPEPKTCAGQITVRTYAIGVNPVDAYIRSGSYSAKPELPYTPGSDAAGVVESVGEGVTRFKIGDRVYVAGTISGAYAEIVAATEDQVHALSGRLTFAQGAAIGIPYSTAYRALFQKARAIPGEVILVHGASGGVGIAAVQLSRAAGMRVICTAGSEAGRALLREQGAQDILDHNDSGHFDNVMELTSGNGVDVILEMLANVNLGKDLEVLARSGRVVVIGSRGKAEIDPREAMRRDAVVMGMLLFNASAREFFTIHSGLQAGFEAGTLSPVIGREFPLHEASRVHHELLESHSSGKIVLIP